MCLKSIFENVNVRKDAAPWNLPTGHEEWFWNPFFKMWMSRPIRWWSLQIFLNVTVMEMFLESIFQNVIVPAATMAILTFFVNVLVMKNMLEIHFSKCKCPGGYDGDPHVFWQCSGHEEHAWNQVFLNVNVPAATMAILTSLGNVLVMKNMLEIKFF